MNVDINVKSVLPCLTVLATVLEKGVTKSRATFDTSKIHVIQWHASLLLLPTTQSTVTAAEHIV